MRSISEKFRENEVRRLYELLNSAEFQAPLTNYNCGDPVPKLAFSVDLQPRTRTSSRYVSIYHWPGQLPSGRSRCLLFGTGYLLDRAVAKLDPDPQEETTREPHCDCSKRDTKEEWVTHPGPDEILSPAKVAAKAATRKAEAAGQEQLENIGTVRLDWTKLELEPRLGGGSLVTKEESLGHLFPGADVDSLTVDVGFKHVAYVVKRGAKELAVVDGVEGKAYDNVAEKNEMYFSPDGMRIGYIAKRGEKRLAVVDGKEGKEYDRIYDLFNPVFSGDSKRVAYIATTIDKMKEKLGMWSLKDFVVVDGVEGRPYELVESIVFSPDGRKLIYFPQPRWNRLTRVVVNEVEGKEHDYAEFATFSPDSSRLAYVAHKRIKGQRGLHFAVVDGKEGKEFSEVSSVRFSPDSKHFAYRAKDGGTVVLVRDDGERKYADVELGPFSPDSRHLAYVARVGANWLVMVDGQKLESLSSKEQSFSPARDLAFSPDGKHLAYIRRSTNWTIVVDGHEVSQSSGVVVSPVFSPDSKRLAFIVARDGKSALVFGGQEGTAYDRFLVWNRRWREDGPRTTGFTFDETGVIHAVALRGDELIRLEISLSAKQE